MYGIFPQVQAPGPTKYDLERKAKADEEEKKRQQALEEENRKRELSPSKKFTSAATRGAAASGKGRSKEDLKRS